MGVISHQVLLLQGKNKTRNSVHNRVTYHQQCYKVMRKCITSFNVFAYFCALAFCCQMSLYTPCLVKSGALHQMCTNTLKFNVVILLCFMLKCFLITDSVILLRIQSYECTFLIALGWCHWIHQQIRIRCHILLHRHQYILPMIYILDIHQKLL